MGIETGFCKGLLGRRRQALLRHLPDDRTPDGWRGGSRLCRLFDLLDLLRLSEVPDRPVSDRGGQHTRRDNRPQNARDLLRIHLDIPGLLCGDITEIRPVEIALFLKRAYFYPRVDSANAITVSFLANAMALMAMVTSTHPFSLRNCIARA
jgi:hypothetical protein